MRRFLILTILVLASLAPVSGAKTCPDGMDCAACPSLGVCQTVLMGNGNPCCNAGLVNPDDVQSVVLNAPDTGKDAFFTPLTVYLLGRSLAPPLPPPQYAIERYDLIFSILSGVSHA